MRRLVSTLFALTTLAATTAAQAPAHGATHPDLTGTWTLDPKNSAGMGVPQSMTLRITKDTKLITFAKVFATPAGDQRSLLMAKLDGSATRNTLGTQGITVDFDLAASWDGPTLVVKTTANVAGQALNQVDRWTLSADGKTLHQDTIITSPQPGQAKLTFIRQ